MKPFKYLTILITYFFQIQIIVHAIANGGQGFVHLIYIFHKYFKAPCNAIYRTVQPLNHSDITHNNFIIKILGEVGFINTGDL